MGLWAFTKRIMKTQMETSFGKESMARSFEQDAAASEAKAGKTLRRSKKHARKAARQRDLADRMRGE